MIGFLFCVPNSLAPKSVLFGWVYLRCKVAFVDTDQCFLQLCSMSSFITKVKEKFYTSFHVYCDYHKYIKICFIVCTCRYSQI